MNESVNRITEGNTAAPDFLKSLPRRNRRIYSAFKVSSRYFLILLSACLAGFLFCTAASDSFIEERIFFDRIASHFTDVFSGCDSLKNCFSVIITASAPDIRYLILLFASGFTFFCGIANSAAIICQGFTFGFSFNYLLSAIKTDAALLPTPKNAIIIFSVSEILMMLFMVFLATSSLLFAYEFRRLRGLRTKILRSPLIYRYVLLYLTAFGLILILNIGSCLASLVIYK